jgi:hypothetical protein
MLWRIARPILPRTALKQLRNFRSLAVAHGQWATIGSRSCVDAEDNPVPWYTYPALEYLRRLDFSASNVFEYGSGNSSLWWAGRSRSVTSVESDPDWYARIGVAARTMSNFHYRLARDRDDYVRSPGVSEADIVVIDGKHRFDCTRHLIEGLARHAYRCRMVIFDNSDWYPRSIGEIATRLGWAQVDFAGFGPINDYTWTTSIFLAPGQRLSEKRILPLGSVTGLEKIAEDD